MRFSRAGTRHGARSKAQLRQRCSPAAVGNLLEGADRHAFQADRPGARTCGTQPRPGAGQTPRTSSELSRHSHQPERQAIHDQQGPDMEPLGCKRAVLRPGGLHQRMVVALGRFGFNTIAVVPAEPGRGDRIKVDGSHASSPHPSSTDCGGGQSTQSADVYSSEAQSC